MRQRSGAGTPISQGKQAVRDAPQMSLHQLPGTMGYSYPTFHAPAPQSQYQQPAQAVAASKHAQISDVDFEAAFADALAHAQEMDQSREQQLPAETTEPQLNQDEKIRIGSDALHYVERHERTPDQHITDADDLARTAGQLLNSVSHDTSEKFQNSQFLSLMRKIRDREVEVRNSDLHDKSTGLPAVSDASTVQDPATTASASHFEFPDMDAVYEPYAATNSDAAWSYFDNETHEQFAGAVTNQPQTAAQQSPYAAYGFDDDQYPHSQIEALHPGGRFYPDQSPTAQKAFLAGSGSNSGASNAEMSGAVPPMSESDNTVDDGAALEKKISASEFEYLDQSAGLARRFARQHETGF
jgi:hypothetical protein